MTELKNYTDVAEFKHVCKDVFRIAYRAYKGTPRKTDAALMAELIALIQSTARWVNDVSAKRGKSAGYLREPDDRSQA